MRIKTAIFSLLFTPFFLGLGSIANADETPNGEQLTNKYCSECHGKLGNVTANKKGDTPNIAGFSAMLIFDSLSQFKDGYRQSIKVKNSNSQLTDMITISKRISEQNLEAIAHFLSSQTFKPAIQNSDKSLIATGKQLHQDLCNDCHGDNGASAEDDTPILAGQWKSYLKRQFEQISKRQRDIPRRMKRKFRKLTENDKKALIEFYVSAKQKH